MASLLLIALNFLCPLYVGLMIGGSYGVAKGYLLGAMIGGSTGLIVASGLKWMKDTGYKWYTSRERNGGSIAGPNCVLACFFLTAINGPIFVALLVIYLVHKVMYPTGGD